MSLDAVFGPAGLLAQKFPGYSSREGQVKFAAAAAEVAQEGGILMADAPTGTGKSIAYLVAAIQRIQQTKKKLVVVTSNIALQEQLCIAPTEKVLTADLRHIPASEVHVGMELIGFDEERDGTRRRYKKAIVESVDSIVRPCFRLTFDDGSTVICSEEHLWLTSNGKSTTHVKWMSAKQMVPRGKRREGSAVVRFVNVWDTDRTYEGGYLAAALDGEGHLSQKASNQYNGFTTKIGFSQNSNQMLEKVRGILQHRNYTVATKNPSFKRIIPTEKSLARGEVYDRCTRLEVYNRNEVCEILGKYRPVRLLSKFDPDKLGSMWFNRKVRLVKKEAIGFQEVLAIGTSTKTLIVNGLASHNCKKDLPMLRELLPQPFTFQIAKGFSNYVCKSAMDEVDNARLMGKRILEDFELQKILEDVINFNWEKGDLSEYPVELPYQVKRLTVISGEDCLGKKCNHYEECYPRQAKKAFGAADVIVTNYHMYAIDLGLRLAGSEKGILPEHEIVVFDEAHNFADLARSYFGDSLTAGSLKSLSAELDASGERAVKLGIPSGIDPELKDQIQKAALRFFGNLERLKGNRKLYQSRLKTSGQVDGKELEQLVRKAADKLTTAAVALNDDARTFLGKRADGLRKRAGLIQAARELSREGWIFYLDGDRNVELKGEPLNVGEFLRNSLWNHPGAPKAKILCSATLATDKSNSGFDFAAKQLGLDKDVHCNVSEIAVDSPFDYNRCALVVPSKEFQDCIPGKQDFSNRVARTLLELAKASGGRTLGLFTSYAGLKEAERVLRADGTFRLLVQGSVPRTTLIKMMKDQPENTILLGTESLFEGVDLPGEALTALLIDKLPFRHAEDPILDAIKTEGMAKGDEWGWFNRWYVPEAIEKWRQGFGRLIRAVGDYGVVVCCDTRIMDKPYGKRFRKALPEQVYLAKDFSKVPSFLEKLKSGEKLLLGKV